MTHRKTVLDNGVRILSEQLPHARSVSLGIWVNVGSRDEVRSENGISHMIEHMMFKGTRTRSNFQIAKEMDAIGGMSNAFTGKEYTCFHTRVLGKHFSLAADILVDIFLNSRFDPLDLEKERQVVLQEIGMLEDTPDDQIHVLFSEAFWRDHPISWPILGSQETVSAIDQTRIFDYIGRAYGPERTVVAAVGQVEHETVVAHLRPLLERLEGGREYAPRRAPEITHGVTATFKDLEQVQVCLGGEAPVLTSPQRFPSILLDVILGGNMSSRLFQEIRERQGLAYSVYSFVSAYLDTGVLGISVAVDPANVNRTLEAIRREVRRLRRGELSPEDLAAAKEYLTGSIFLAAEHNESRMMRLAKNEFIWQRYIPDEEVADRIERVTLDEVIQVANEVFAAGKVSLVTLGPCAAGDLDLGCLQF